MNILREQVRWPELVSRRCVAAARLSVGAGRNWISGPWQRDIHKMEQEVVYTWCEVKERESVSGY